MKALMIEPMTPPPITIADTRQEPAGNKAADNADDDAADQPIAAALDHYQQANRQRLQRSTK